MAVPSIETKHITPLVTIHHPAFARSYEEERAHSLDGNHEHSGPLHDLYLVDMFTLAQRFGLFEPHRTQDLLQHIGSTLGEIHGGVLLPDGTVRPDTSTLVTLEDEDVTCGYHAGREFFFTQADTQEQWHMSEKRLMEWLYSLAQEEAQDDDAARTVRFHLGCLLGELSGHLFSWTREEQHALEQESLRILGYVEPLNPACLAARQFCGQTV